MAGYGVVLALLGALGFFAEALGYLARPFSTLLRVLLLAASLSHCPPRGVGRGLRKRWPAWVVAAAALVNGRRPAPPPCVGGPRRPSGPASSRHDRCPEEEQALARTENQQREGSEYIADFFEGAPPLQELLGQYPQWYRQCAKHLLRSQTRKASAAEAAPRSR